MCYHVVILKPKACFNGGGEVAKEHVQKACADVLEAVRVASNRGALRQACRERQAQAIVRARSKWCVKEYERHNRCNVHRVTVCVCVCVCVWWLYGKVGAHSIGAAGVRIMSPWCGNGQTSCTIPQRKPGNRQGVGDGAAGH